MIGDDTRALTDRHRPEDETFARFWRTIGPAPPRVTDLPAGGKRLHLRASVPAGWIPYAIGAGPAPPEGMENVHPTAWGLPG